MPVTPSLRSRAGSEPFASLNGKLREGSGLTGAEILRCLFAALRASAQDDSQDPSPVRLRKLISKYLGYMQNPCLAFQKLVYFEHRWICYPMAVG